MFAYADGRISDIGEHYCLTMMRTICNAIIAAGLFVAPVASAAAETLCPMIYQPVCAAKGNVAKTFANRCIAESEGYDVISAGRCGESGSRSKLKIKATLSLPSASPGSLAPDRFPLVQG